MTTEEELRAKLRKIAALYEGAATPGERDAAAAAIARVRKALGEIEHVERPIEIQISIPDRWARRLFTALCRRYGMEPYRYKRQREATMMLKVPRSFFDNTLWPEYAEIKHTLDAYLSQETERIIREEIG